MIPSKKSLKAAHARPRTWTRLDDCQGWALSVPGQPDAPPSVAIVVKDGDSWHYGISTSGGRSWQTRESASLDEAKRAAENILLVDRGPGSTAEALCPLPGEEWY